MIRLNLQGRRVPVTGGSAGPGQAIAEATYVDLKDVTPRSPSGKPYAPPLAPAHLGEQVADILAGPRYPSGIAYGLTAGDTPVGPDT